MRIKDIQLTEVKRGTNWRLMEADEEAWRETPMEEWRIEPAEPHRATDHAVYSGPYVLENGSVRKDLGQHER